MTAVEICNLALGRITQASIQSLDEENSVAALYCKMYYEQDRKSLLRAFPWNFALKRGRIAQLAGTPIGWAYRFALPRECIRVRQITTEGYAMDHRNPFRIPYEIEGADLLCNIKEPILVYTEDKETPNDFDPLFTDAFVLRMALDLCMPLSGDKELRAQINSEYLTAVKQAASVGSNENKLTIELGGGLVEAYYAADANELRSGGTLPGYVI
jgi:hypothetical protein